MGTTEWQRSVDMASSNYDEGEVWQEPVTAMIHTIVIHSCLSVSHSCEQRQGTTSHLSPRSNTGQRGNNSALVRSPWLLL